MSFSINTNVTSLQAENYLTQSSSFQAKTISEVTSGLRIVNSGDDAAGLAVANSLQSSQAVLTQGVQNAANGLATLQTIDGGLSNINTLLDRAQTLATESASGTFTGSRATLNTEFQSVLTEINRQSTSIGLNSGGQFAKALTVFIGGGQGSTAAAQTANGSVSIDLSKAAVDTQSLGLTAFGAQSSTAYDLGTGATSVTNIVTNATNTASEATAGYTNFTFSGVGFGDTKTAGTLNQNTVSISVNLSNVTDTASLASAINSAIGAAGTAGSANATAFQNAGISAKIVQNAAGGSQLAFESATSTFQVQAGDKVATALVGNLAVAGAPAGAAITTAASALSAAGTQSVLSGAAGSAPKNFAYTAISSATETQTVTFGTTDANGTIHSKNISLTQANSGSIDTAIETINNALQTSNDPELSKIVAFKDATGGNITFGGGGNQFTLALGSVTDSAAAPTVGDGIGASADQGKSYTSGTNGASSNQDISTATNAQNAINALSSAIAAFGTSQAAVGRGENNLNYATNLAQSQLTNEASAESNLKDANLATEAANLTKAQILVQAGTAALAQANSAPQALLSLLK